MSHRFAVRAFAAEAIALAITAAIVPVNTPLPIIAPAQAAPQDALVNEFARRERLFGAQRYDEVVKQADECAPASARTATRSRTLAK